MTAIFITATGADVGTTPVVAALIRQLRQIGRSVEAIKPIASGYDPVQAATSETGMLLSALGQPFTPEAVERISPWRFRSSLPPDVAAREEGRSIDVDAVIAYCQTAIERRRDVLLIDGGGEVMTPLDEHRTILDLMMALQLPLILITGSHPAAISHVLTALDSLYRREINVLATIVSETAGSGLPLNEAVSSIGRFAAPVIGVPLRR